MRNSCVDDSLFQVNPPLPWLLLRKGCARLVQAIFEKKTYCYDFAWFCEKVAGDIHKNCHNVIRRNDIFIQTRQTKMIERSRFLSAGLGPLTST
ncbi:MAG TPA: hypothetical protein DCE42_24285 [Myxococcales bacterium]|nr:hypothetical protein [Deltaproteobacteria bacterium]MBU50719.1 hypothetical protein [Deltaproteobacteria bacterium]HAA57905.1 hypothetical protein [Myxococcales bacterium]